MPTYSSIRPPSASEMSLDPSSRGLGYRRLVNRLEIRAFAEHHLDAAGSLLATRHREHRAAEPLLSERFEHPDATRAEVASLWAQKHASGAVALREGRVVGYLLGTRKDDRTRGANVWIESAGYSVDEPELIRDLYALSSQRWVDEGRTRHYALVPQLDEHLAAWFRLSFGAQQAHGITPVDRRAWPAGTRHAEPEDELRTLIAAEITNDKLGELVFESAGHVVASFELAPVEMARMHRGLAQPDNAACITGAASLPDVRGSGAGVALTDAAHAWAREQGYATIVTDWRETNLLASRFWPARGFRRSFLRLYRSIP